jgi:hypothetical protein
VEDNEDDDVNGGEGNLNDAKLPGVDMGIDESDKPCLELEAALE